MAVFTDTDELYRVLDALFQHLSGDESIAKALLAGKFVLRFRYKEPDGQVTIDLRGEQLVWEFGETSEKADLTMIQSGDTAHQFWLGKLNIPRAIATRRVVARGPVSKALKLLPAVRGAFPVYPEVLRGLGMGDRLDKAAPRENPVWKRVQHVRDQLLEWSPARVVRRFVSRGQRVEFDLAELNRHHIPLVTDATLEAPRYRDQELPTNPKALKLAMLERMMLIRAFETRLSEANALGEVPTEAIHLSIGQEAAAVGVCFALRSNDFIATTHRGHGHMLAKGADLDGMMAEIMAKASGLCGGKGGSMHVTEAAVGAIGANGIVGASPLIASGAAHSSLRRGTDQVAVAFLGDGATNQGMFHEALNFASVFQLPALFVVENNLYGEFTPVSQHMRLERIADRAAAYGMPGQTVDGNDVWAVYEATVEALAKTRKGGGPILLELLTYRWHGHMEGEAVDYRSAEEIAEWKAKCPIKSWSASLRKSKQLTKKRDGELEAAARQAVETALQKALAGDEPTADQLATNVFGPDNRVLFESHQTPTSDRIITCSQALFEALSEEMERDDSVYLLGEDVVAGGYFAVTAGLGDVFGRERIIDTPISEYAIVGTAVGAAMTGQRPVAEILFSDFLTTCMDPLVNQAAKLRYMSDGQYAMPLVVRTPGGGGLGMAAQHSQSLEALLTGVPGLIILAPATPYDAKGMLKAAIRSNNPVLFFENKLLYTATGAVPEGDYLVPIGVADVKRQGTDVTVVSIGAALGNAIEAAERLGADGTSVEIVDVRSLVPLDLATIVTSVAKTGRLVTVEDGVVTSGFGGEIIARVAEVALSALKAPPTRVGAHDIPIPYNTTLENMVLPDADRVVDAVRKQF